jgi:hypothetical protein
MAITLIELIRPTRVIRISSTPKPVVSLRPMLRFIPRERIAPGSRVMKEEIVVMAFFHGMGSPCPQAQSSRARVRPARIQATGRTGDASALAIYRQRDN